MTTNKVTTNKANAADCTECGMAHSFFFGTTFHKEGCTNITKADLDELKVSDKPIKIIKTL